MDADEDTTTTTTEETISGDESVKKTKLKTVTWKTLKVRDLLITLAVLAILAFVGMVISLGFIGSLWIQQQSNQNNNQNLNVTTLTASDSVSSRSLAVAQDANVGGQLVGNEVESMTGLFSKTLSLSNQDYMYWGNITSFTVDNGGAVTMLPASNINQTTLITQGDGFSMNPTSGITTISATGLWLAVACVKWVASSTATGTAPDVILKGVFFDGDDVTSAGSSQVNFESPWEVSRNTENFLVQPIFVQDDTPQYFAFQVQNRTGATQTVSNVFTYLMHLW